MAHLELGRGIFTKIKADLWAVSKIERDSKMEGRRMTLVLQPDHKQPGAKPPTLGSPPTPGTAAARPTAMSAGSTLNIPARPPEAPAQAAAQAPPPAPVAAPATR
jgi:hypothetical protein